MNKTLEIYFAILFVVIIGVILFFGIYLCIMSMVKTYKSYKIKDSLSRQEKWFNSLPEYERKIVKHFWATDSDIRKYVLSPDWKKVIALTEDRLNATIKNRNNVSFKIRKFK